VDAVGVGRRKIVALMRADGHAVSTSTVQPALRRCGLLLPVGYQADRKSWAVLGRRVFLDPLDEPGCVQRRMKCVSARRWGTTPRGGCSGGRDSPDNLGLIAKVLRRRGL
jgi:hypothetical protein